MQMVFSKVHPDGASFMSFGTSFQTRTVEGKKELENKLVCTL